MDWAIWPAVELGHHSLAIDAILVRVIRHGLSRPLEEGRRASGTASGPSTTTSG